MLMAVNISVTVINAKLAQKFSACVKNTNSVAVLTTVWTGAPRNLGSITGRSTKDSLYSLKRPDSLGLTQILFHRR